MHQDKSKAFFWSKAYVAFLQYFDIIPPEISLNTVERRYLDIG